MRNVIVGSFIGFVLAAAFLAACGSGTENPTPPRSTSPRALTWTPPGATFPIATGLQVSGGSTWTTNTVYDNTSDLTRDRFAVFEIAGNIESSSSGPVTFDVGILPTVDGSRYATDPTWLGSTVVPVANNRRVALVGLPLPPLRFKFALRLSASATVTARLSSFTLTPYDEELP